MFYVLFFYISEKVEMMESESAPDAISDFESNNRWITENYENLKRKYKNQWVAVLNNAVLDCDADLKKLVTRLKKQHLKFYNKIAVEYVDSEEKGTMADESVEI
jgi:hypothetical protein